MFGKFHVYMTHAEGQSLVEYALLLAFLASLIMGAVMPAGSAVATVFTHISTVLAAASPGCPPGTFCINGP